MTLAALQRSWRQIKRDQQPETIFVVAKQNYEIAAYLGLTRHATTWVTVVLDTGAGPSFIKHSLIPYEFQKHVQPLESQLSERDAGNQLVSIAGTISLSVNVKSQSTIEKFNAVKRLGTEAILGCDFCDAHVKAIRPGKQVIKLAVGTTVPILKGPQTRSKNMAPIPGNQEYIAPMGRPNCKVFASETVLLQPESQNSVTVSTPQTGFLPVKPYRKLYKTKQCFAPLELL